jgi:hypothetical protein
MLGRRRSRRLEAWGRKRSGRLIFVMAGLVPAIHVLLADSIRKTWMPGTRPGMTASYINAPILDFISGRSLRVGQKLVRALETISPARIYR